ncbi:MAG: hypothetical protein V1647_03975 [Pseudomonadota bacterium]
MKKLFLVAAVALLATSVFASEMKMDAKLGYAKVKGGASGFNVSPAMYYSLYQGDGFVKDFSLGMNLDFLMARAAGVWGYSMFLGPEGRLEMPYSYFKLAFGYDYYRAAGVNSNLFAVKFGAGFLYPVADATKLGLDVSFAYTLNSGNVGQKLWMLSVGPVVSFDL